jgi:hypothetical protein
MRLTLEPGDEPVGPRGHYIITTLATEWAQQFAESNVHYGDDAHGDLGIRAQFVDINRKVRVLRRVFWDGAVTTREDPRKILLELIGHCFLAVELLDHAAPDPDEDVITVSGTSGTRRGPRSAYCRMATAVAADPYGTHGGRKPHEHEDRCITTAGGTRWPVAT